MAGWRESGWGGGRSFRPLTRGSQPSGRAKLLLSREVCGTLHRAEATFSRRWKRVPNCVNISPVGSGPEKLAKRMMAANELKERKIEMPAGLTTRPPEVFFPSHQRREIPQEESIFFFPLLRPLCSVAAIPHAGCLAIVGHVSYVLE